MDLNGDGHPDILSGSYSAPKTRPMAGHFYVLWGQKGNTFQKPAALTGTDGKPLEITPGKGGDAAIDRICTRPTAVDWDADGHLDLVVGNFAGTFVLFKGEGKGKFSPKSTFIKINGQPLSVTGYHSDPVFVDWDKDGDLDLLSGSGQGGAWWAENTAGPDKPVSLKKFVQLIAPSTKSTPVWADEEPTPSSSSRLFADDLNGDGKIDLLLGDNVVLSSPRKGKSKEETLDELNAWQEELAKTRQTLGTKQDEKSREELQEKMSRLFAKHRDLVEQKSTGHVWLYLRK